MNQSIKNWLLTSIIGFSLINFPFFPTRVLAQDNEINNPLNNTIYYLPDGEAITLSGGRYETGNKVFVLSEKVAIADINNDQLQDFFVILTELEQGIELNNYVAVLLGNNNQQLDNVDTLFIDNEIDINNLTWTDQVLTVEFMVNSPSRKKKLKYHFDLGSETLIPLTLQTEKKPGDIFIREPEIIEPDFNNREENPSIRIEL